MTAVRIKVPNWLDRIFTLPLLIYRLCRFGDSFRRIYLGEGLWTILSLQDYYVLNDYNWYLSSNGTNFYAFRNAKIGPGKVKMVSMHRQIMQDQLNTNNSKLKTKLVVDHKNNDTLDNRRPNLRIATHSQNAYNRKKIKTKTSSKYIGVYYEKRTGRWTVKIRTNGKRLWLGRFKSEITAAKAYDRAARKYHKEFAVLNFPD